MMHSIEGLIKHRNAFARIAGFGMKTASIVAPRVGQQYLITRTKKTLAPASKFDSSGITEVLMRELVFEKDEEESGEIDQEFIDIKKVILKKFTLKDNIGEGFVYLSRMYKDEEILVKFDCQNESEMETDLNEELQQAESMNEEDVVDEPNYGVNFQVLIKRNNSQMVVQCVAAKELVVTHVYNVPLGKKEDDVLIYAGPKFTELDDELRMEFQNYLEERNIDQDFSYFVLTYAKQKEQQEYVNWLEKLSEFVAAK